MFHRLITFFTMSAVLAAGGVPACMLSSGSTISAAIGARGLESVSLIANPTTKMVAPTTIAVTNDNFQVLLNDTIAISSADLSAPTVAVSNASVCILRFQTTLSNHPLLINVSYALVDRHVSKTLSLQHAAGMPPYNVTSVTVVAGAHLTLAGAPPDGPAHVVSSPHGLGDYATFLRWGQQRVGAFASVQNPYLNISNSSTSLNVAYAPMMVMGGGGASPCAFVSDAAVLGVLALSGRTLAPPAEPVDESEQVAFVSALAAYEVAPARADQAVSINVAWTENDYQLDISLAADRTEYKRIIDRAAQMGIRHLLFAPRNSDVSCRANNTDAWGWEQLLWFGMGQRLRQGLWAPGDPLPDSLVEMLDHFRKRNVKPVAYVYPILAFLANTLPGGGSPPWIVPGTYDGEHRGAGEQQRQRRPPRAQPGSREKNGPPRSNLASPDFQEWLPSTLLAFANATGAGGFSFDYTYFEEQPPIASQYAQWAGWRQILHRLHTGRGCAGGRCVVDNRQANHAWGPWMWVQGGTYAEPLMSDEQPGSWMFYEADLHTDRLSANRQRQIAWQYRQLEFAPADVIPGFAFHQTDRDVTPKQRAIPGCGDGRCSNASRRRDFDLLGYRYSLLSSIATGGLNNVMCYLPARDAEEYRLLPKEDLAFVRGWLGWADANVELLRQTRVLRTLPAPSFGNLDGVSMIGERGGGVLFLFNPTTRELNFTEALTYSTAEGVGLGVFSSVNPAAAIRATQIDSSDRHTRGGPFDLSLVEPNGTLTVLVPPTTALVVGLEPWDDRSEARPRVFGAFTKGGTIDSEGTLRIEGARGEVGTSASLFTTLPKGTGPARAVKVNGVSVAFTAGSFLGVPTVSIRGRWGDGPRFMRNQPISQISAAAGGWKGEFTVPAAVLAQLRARNQTWPLTYDLDPNSTNDANTPWLGPGRLLIFLKYRSLLNDTLNVSGSIDGAPLLMRKAYNTIVPSPTRFIGHWADVTGHVIPDQTQSLSLSLPPPGRWTVRRGALTAGGDLRKVSASVSDAQAACDASELCEGLTFRLPVGSPGCEATEGSSEKLAIYLKLGAGGNGDAAWCTFIKPATFEGVFFENVEVLTTDALRGVDV
jgi:hypothetical protein